MLSASFRCKNADAHWSIVVSNLAIERNTMKAIITTMGVGALVVATVTLARAQTVVYSQNFESQTGETPVVSGQLVGQDGWVSFSNGTGIQIGVGTGQSAGGNLGVLDDKQTLPYF